MCASFLSTDRRIGFTATEALSSGYGPPECSSSASWDPVEVVGDEGPVPLGGPKQRATLAILLHDAKRVVSVERLADDLYSGAAPSPWVKGGFGDDAWGHLRCILARANKHPAVACYVKRAGDSEYGPLALDVLRIEDGKFAEITVFSLERLVEALRLPRTL